MTVTAVHRVGAPGERDALAVVQRLADEAHRWRRISSLLSASIAAVESEAAEVDLFGTRFPRRQSP